MKATLPFALASLTSMVGIADAQPVTKPDQIEASQIEAGALGVEVMDPGNALVADEVLAAIGTELGVRIVGQGAYAPALGRLEIALDQGEVRIAYHPAAGTVIERTFALPIEPADRLQLIAFVATNLVRDQASEVLGGLPTIVIPPPAPASKPVTTPPDRYMPFTIGLVPPLTLDRALGERVTVGFGLHAVMGMTDAVNIASISGAADVITGDLSGLQIGGAGAVTLGHARGIQLGGAVSFARGSFFGAQIGGAAAVAGRARGLQIGGAATVADRLYGLQIAGGVSVAGRVDGAQIAGGVNVGGDVNGVQIGTINIARKMRGVQVGVINLSDDGDDSYPIGVINYSRNGGVAIDGWVDSSRVSALAFRHGTKHIHNIWSLGWSPDHDNVLVGAGLGITRNLGDKLSLDVDGMCWFTDVWDQELNQLNQLRASLSFPIANNLELFGGVAANVYVTDVMQDNTDDFHPTMARTYQPTDATNVVLWPSAFAGVRLRAR